MEKNFFTWRILCKGCNEYEYYKVIPADKVMVCERCGLREDAVEGLHRIVGKNKEIIAAWLDACA